MKLTTVLYSLLIFISCANNTAKDRQHGKTIEKSSESQTVIHEEETPKVVLAKTDTEGDGDQEVTKTVLDPKQKANLKEMGDVVRVSEERVVAKPSTADVIAQEISKPTVEKGTDVSDKQEEPHLSSSGEDTRIITVAKVPSHNAWDVLLQKYVDRAGNVDYGAFRSSRAELSAYLEVLAQNEPKSDWSKNEKLAYYINLYNAATVKLILDNYPTKSIKDIKKPWGKDIVKVGGNLVSLGYIEHKVLRKMNEPRIHFAINCASYSCPKLVNKAFTAAAMEQQLEAATNDFVNDTTRNQFSAEEAKLSEIFKWYKGDFTSNGSLKEYINKYLARPMTANTKIKYLKYNWNLNEK